MELREAIAKQNYTTTVSHSVRTPPEAPRLPTWDELGTDIGTLTGYFTRVRERYLREADALIVLVKEHGWVEADTLDAMMERALFRRHKLGKD